MSDRVPSVLHVLTCDANAGTEIVVATLVENTDPGLVRSEVVTLAPQGPIAARLQAAGIPARSLGGGGFVRGLLRLVALLRSESHDIVVAYGYRVSMVARFAARARRPRPRFIAAVHGLHQAEVPNRRKARLLLMIDR